jgi:hypothetical protein
MYVPVVDSNNKPLMSTTPARARKWIKSGKATPFWKLGIFCVRLNVQPSAHYLQKTTLAIDPGSKKEGLTIKARAHTFLNIQADATTWVKEALEQRRNQRRSRRQRKTPYRACRSNRASLKKNRIPPSTLARWDSKLRIVKVLIKIFPISHFVVEDIKAKTQKNKRRWNASFSPLEVGKRYF